MKYKDPQDGSMKDVGAIIGGNVGKNGEDGFSPIANVKQTESGATITIVDKNGETSVNIKNGEKGQDGLDGKSAYQYAKDGGYTGTEVEFAEKLAKEIPKKTSDLENDSGFITKEDIPSIDIPDVDLSEYATKEYVENYSVVLSHDGNGNATIEGLVVLVDGNEVEY